MKKILMLSFWGLIILTAFALTGCKKNGGEPLAETSTLAPQTERQETKPPESSLPTKTPTATAAPDDEASETEASETIEVSGLSPISAGWVHSMAVKKDGSLWAWGDNEYGQLGDGTTDERHSPVKIMDGVQFVSAGRGHTMAIKTDGSLWAWGNNDHGQLGDGTSTDSLTPIKIMDSVVFVSAGWEHTAAIKADGSLWTWGGNEHGQLGDGTTEDRHTPEKVMDGVQSVSAGVTHTMSIKSDRSLWSFGYYKFHEREEDARRTTPEKVEEIESGVRFVWAGNKRTIIIDINGNMIYIDKDKYFDPITQEVRVFSAGTEYTVYIRSDGSCLDWGVNEYGQLGDGTNEDRNYITKITDNMQWLSSGYAHTIAIRSSGNLWAWGLNENGQLGDGTTENRNAPVRIMDGVKFPK